jgi:uncharacterized protein YggE
MDSKTEDIRKLNVVGEAVLRLKPDVAFVNVFVRSDGILLQDAAKESASRVDQVRQALLDAYSNIRDIHIQEVFEPANAKEEAITLAIDNAKDKARHLARFMAKNIGAIDQVSLLEFHVSFEAMRHRHAALSRVKYLSNSADRIEIPAKDSVAFILTD